MLSAYTFKLLFINLIDIKRAHNQHINISLT